MRAPLILILLIGIMTPVGATLLYYFAPPESRVSVGEILPPQQTPAKWQLANGKWTLLLASEGECGEQCIKRLCQMRQLRLMLPGHYLRVQRAWLRPQSHTPANGNNHKEELPELYASTDCGEERAAEYAPSAEEANITAEVLSLTGDLNTLPAPAPGKVQSDYLYLSDPAGVLAMRFPPELTAYQIRKDLAKLLKISKGRRQIEK